MNEAAHHSDPSGVASPEDDGVSGVLASLEQLDSLPVHEHVGVFERAHETLRRALDAPRQG